MGKIRVKTFGDEEQELKDKAEREAKKAERKAREEAESREETTTEESEQTKSPDLASQGDALQGKTVTDEEKPVKKAKKTKFIKKKVRSAAYKTKLMEIEKHKVYSLSDGIELLRKVKIAKFDETVELHINTTESGISGNVKLPHGTGKEIRIAIADDTVLAEV